MNVSSIIAVITESPITWIIIGGVVLWKAASWKSGIDNGLEYLSKRIDDMSKRIDDIHMMIKGRFGPAVDQSSSPVTLTDYGKKLSEKINAKKIVGLYTPKLNVDTEGMNAYKIQEHCFIFCRDELLPELEKSHKDCFDKISSVAYEDGIDIGKATRVIAIGLRDEILSMRGIAHAEVDKHSPD